MLPQWRFEALGATWQIDSHLAPDAAARDRLLGVAKRFDQTYSRFRSDSLVSELARTGGPLRFPADLPRMLDLYDLLVDVTNGAVNPLLGHSLNALGYDAEYSLRRQGPDRPAPPWSSLIRDGTVVRVRAPIPALTGAGGHSTADSHDEFPILDIGALGKGALVDHLMTTAIDLGLDPWCVDGSGDLVVRGPDPVRVALEHPADPSQAIGIVELENEAIAASGISRRQWGAGLHHVLDARTGMPTTDIVATWAIAPQAMLADALSTALFFVHPEALAERCDAQFVRITSAGRIQYSPDLRGDIFR